MTNLNQIGLPDPNHFASVGWVIVIVTCIIVMLSVVINFWRSITNQPTDMRVVTDCVKEAECDKRHKELQDKFETVESRRIVDAKDAAGSRKGMYEEMKRLDDKLSRHIEEIRRELSQKIDDKLDSLPMQIVTLLRNAREIK